MTSDMHAPEKIRRDGNMAQHEWRPLLDEILRLPKPERVRHPDWRTLFFETCLSDRTKILQTLVKRPKKGANKKKNPVPPSADSAPVSAYELSDEEIENMVTDVHGRFVPANASLVFSCGRPSKEQRTALAERYIEEVPGKSEYILCSPEVFAQQKENVSGRSFASARASMENIRPEEMRALFSTALLDKGQKISLARRAFEKCVRAAKSGRGVSDAEIECAFHAGVVLPEFFPRLFVMFPPVSRPSDSLLGLLSLWNNAEIYDISIHALFGRIVEELGRRIAGGEDVNAYEMVRFFFADDMEDFIPECLGAWSGNMTPGEFEHVLEKLFYEGRTSSTRTEPHRLVYLYLNKEKEEDKVREFLRIFRNLPLKPDFMDFSLYEHIESGRDPEYFFPQPGFSFEDAGHFVERLGAMVVSDTPDAVGLAHDALSNLLFPVVEYSRRKTMFGDGETWSVVAAERFEDGMFDFSSKVLGKFKDSPEKLGPLAGIALEFAYGQDSSGIVKAAREIVRREENGEAAASIVGSAAVAAAVMTGTPPMSPLRKFFLSGGKGKIPAGRMAFALAALDDIDFSTMCGCLMEMYGTCVPEGAEMDAYECAALLGVAECALEEGKDVDAEIVRKVLETASEVERRGGDGEDVLSAARERVEKRTEVCSW